MTFQNSDDSHLTELISHPTSIAYQLVLSVNEIQASRSEVDQRGLLD